MVRPDPPKVRWGVIGCGQIAHDKALPAIELADNAELVALADPDAQRLERALKVAPQAKGFAAAEDLLAEPAVQAVYIATPNFLHAAQTIAAAHAGKHVLVEKPMCMNAAEARQMVAAADKAGIKLMVAYMALFNPAFETAKRVVDAGLLGEIVFARARHSYSMNPERLSSAALWRLDSKQGGGPLMDVALYAANALRTLTGYRIRILSATAANRKMRDTTEFDSVVVSFVQEDGTPGVFEGSFTYPSSTVELEGTAGRLSLEGHITQAIDGRLEVTMHFPGSRRIGHRITHQIDPEGLPHFYNYWREIEHFSHCILAGEEPLPSGRAVIAEMVVADAVRESLRLGRSVEVNYGD